MTENAKNSTAQSTIQDPPEYNAKSPKEGSDWLGGPQNGNETSSSDQDGSPEPSTQDYTKHRFSDALTKEDKAWTGSGKA